MKAILAVIASFLVLLSLVSIVGANPTTNSYTGPSSPDTSLPKITISLPENGTIFSQIDVSYSIVINKPSSWFDYGPWNGQIFSVAYSLDNNTEITIAEKEFDPYESVTSKAPITLQGTLSGLSNGNHTFQVLLFGVSYYQDANQMKGVPSNYYIRNNATATFSVDTTLEANVTPTATSTLNPTTTVVGANPSVINPTTAAIIAVGIIAIILVGSFLLYAKHRRTAKPS
jgi:hypothetical protein